MKGRVMALDYGDARTGVAVSDESASLAGEVWVIQEKNQRTLAATIAAEASSRGVTTIVVGYPKNMDGTVGPSAQKSERLAEHIKGLCDIGVVLWDERMTTISANRILTDTGRYGRKRRNTVDAVAASVILESYLQAQGAE